MSIKARYIGEEREELKQIVLEMRKNGRYIPEIADKIGVPKSTVRIFEKELIEEGRITKKEIEEAVSARKENEKKSNSNDEKVRVGLAVEGKSNVKISKELEISIGTVKKIRKKLLENGVVTEEEIENAKKRNKEIEEKLLKEKILIALAHEGKTLLEIMDEFNIGDLIAKRIKRELIEDGKTTNKEIAEARKRRKNKQMEANEQEANSEGRRKYTVTRNNIKVLTTRNLKGKDKE